ncbi:MAG: AMP-binding protein [Acidimicrobiales bacterium]
MTTLAGPPLASVEGIGATTLGGFLAEVVTRYGDNEALVFDDPLKGDDTQRWSYTELYRQARQVARALGCMALGKGARVGILMGNRPEAVAAIFGASLAGCVAVPISTFSAPPELEYILGHADISVLLTQTLMGKLNLASAVAGLGPPQLPYLARVIAVGLGPPFGPSGEMEPLSPQGFGAGGRTILGWDEFLASGEGMADEQLDAMAAGVHHSDPALIIYSSGTTDRPKGILHHHRAPTLSFWLQAGLFGRDQHTRMWTALPLFWTAGFNTAMGATLAAGGCWVMQEFFEPGQALRLMTRERVTEPYTLPHQTTALEEHPDWPDADLSSLRCVFGKSGLARHPSVSGDTSWNMPVGYGLSETCAFFAAHPCHTARSLMRQSTGRLLPGNELRTLDPTSGHVLGPDQEGEFVIRGPSLMEHYVKAGRPDCFDADGFFHTGDIGHYDAEGYVHWSGRRSEMIKTGGANVSPAELEVQLRACSPVKLARVVGIPDPRLDQIVVAAVVVKDGFGATEDEIKSFLRSRVASYKVPKRVLFFADGQIPMTSSDTKVRDAQLVALVQDRLDHPADPTVPSLSSGVADGRS